MSATPQFARMFTLVVACLPAVVVAACMNLSAEKPVVPFVAPTDSSRSADLVIDHAGSLVAGRHESDLSLIPPVQAIADSDQSALLPPALVETVPASGSSWDGRPVVFVFDQPLSASSADAVTVEPELPGTASIRGNELIFEPSAAPVASTRYQFILGQGITGEQGTHIISPIAVTLVAAVPLQVTSTQPGADTQDVDTASQIVISFNRPVVPLVGVDAQDGLPQPLTINPPVSGSGRWLNTSIYVFEPDSGLAGSTNYDVVISNINGLGGESLQEPYAYSFSTAAPIVLSTSPNGDHVRPASVISVEFSQPMDPKSTGEAFSLRRMAGNMPPTVVDGKLIWNDTNTLLSFTPADTLRFGAEYQVQVTTEARSASLQGNLREVYYNNFTVVPLPAIQSVSPVGGADGVGPESSVIIAFNTAVSPTLAAANIDVTPLLTTTHVFSYYSYYDNSIQLSWFKDPGTQYTVTIGGQIADEYGNTLGEDYSFSFTTGDYSPFVRLEGERFTHFSAYTETRLSALYRNIDWLNVDLYRVPQSELFMLTGDNQWQVWDNYQIPNRNLNRVWHRNYETVEEKNVSIRQVITLTDVAGNVLPPGTYLLEVDPPPDPDGSLDPSKRSQTLLFLSNYNMVLKKSQQGRSLAWLTDLRTGQPVPNEQITFYTNGLAVGSATTDVNGTVLTSLEIDQEQKWAPVLAISGDEGHLNYAVVSSEWNSGIATWDFGLNGGWGADDITAFIYTDRPIYRPGQTVYWKGIIRKLHDDQYELPPQGLPIHVEVRDDIGNTIYREEVILNEHGSVNGRLELSPEAITGYYYLEVRIPLDDEQSSFKGTSFQVASYQKPEFEISLTAEQNEYVQGDTIRVRARASYFSGGPLADVSVTWLIVAQPFFYNWADAPDDRFYTFTPFDPEQETYDPYRDSLSLGLVGEGTGRTNREGEFTIEIPAELAQAVQSQQWLFDVTFQSPTNQFVSGSINVPIHVANVYVGLSTTSYVSHVEEEATIDLVTVTPQGDPYRAADIEVTVYEYEWNSVYERTADGSYRWDSSVSRTPVYSTTTTSDRLGRAAFAWTPKKGGQYQIVGTTSDDAGHMTSSSLFLWVSSVDSTQFIAWPRENNDRIKLVADRALYTPGDSAKILVPSPFSGPVQALLTIERGGVLESRLITLEGNSETLEIPITAQHIPNIYVGVFIAKGIDETNPTPAMRAGYAQLMVDTAEKELSVQAEPSAKQVKPSATITYTLLVRDSLGTPISEAEVNVALIDKAIFSLALNNQQKMVDVFYYQRPLDVNTGALLTINRDRMSQQLSEGAKGGGGGGGGGLELRQDFPDIAYWRADFVTDDRGMIQFSVALPDNLTTWRLVARAVTDDTKVGETTDDIVATKELQLRTLLPRFFTAGDRAKIGAVVMNTSMTAMPSGTLKLQMEGASIEGGQEAEANISLDAAEQILETWPIAVDAGATEVVVTLSSTATTSDNRSLSDAVRISLPVHRYESSETVATAGTVPPEGTLEVIFLPEAASDSGELLVTMEPSLASSMVGGLSYLQHYPYECNEQTVSRFLPNLFAARALRQLNIRDDDLEENLAHQLSVGVQRLINRQNADGGWGYWPGEDSTTFITSYVLWGLATAGQMDHAIPQSTLDSAVDYLERHFQAPKDLPTSWQLNEMAFMHYVLAEMGEGDPGRAITLFDVRERLGLYGKALLAMAFANMVDAPDLQPYVDTLLDDLVGAAKLSATTAWWQEQTVDYFTLNTDTRTTSMILSAFARLDPEQPLLPMVVRWLTEIREASRWSSTQENAWAVIALTDWLEASGELEANYDWQVELNGSLLGSGSVDSSNLGQSTQLRAYVVDLLRGEANNVAFARDSSQGQLYYTTRLRYYLDALAIDARDRGIVVDRRFSLRGADDIMSTNAAAVGDVISVTVTIVAPTDLHQLLVEVPIPAGTEPIDPELLTTSRQFGNPQLAPAGEGNRPWWYFWQPTHTDMRDDKVALFATFLPAGTYEYTFNVRASLPGEYRVLPVYAEQMYFNEVWGRSAGTLFTVRD